MEDYEAGAEELGVATALERTCMLEARLRQAIQDTHVVSRDYGHDAEAAAHEHSALLNIKDQLELLEDKLREYRALDDHQQEDKTVVLSQLDSLRRELITIAQDGFAAVTYSKEVVREVQAFAEMRDDFTTDSDTESEMTYDFAEDGSAYSSFSPERLPGGQQHGSMFDALEGSVPPGSPQSRRAQTEHTWAERRPDSTSYTPQQASSRMPKTAHHFAGGSDGSSSPGAGTNVPAGHTRRQAPEYLPAADRILTGHRQTDHSAHTSIADRIMLGGMPGSPEAQPPPPSKLQLGGSHSDVAPQRSPSVQAPVTPESPEPRKPRSSRTTSSSPSAALPGGGRATRTRNMWPGASAQPAAYMRDSDKFRTSHSSTGADDPQFGGKLDVQGLAARPALTNPHGARPQMPYAQDASAGGGTRGRGAAQAANRGYQSGGSGERPRRLRGTLAVLTSAAVGAAALVLYQNQNGGSSRSGKAMVSGVASRLAGVQPVRRQRCEPTIFGPLPDVNGGRG